MDDEPMTGEPARDPLLAAALRDVAGDPPARAVDWEHLRSGIAARAESRLARRRRDAVSRDPAWWEYAAGWSRAGVPALLAASALIAVLLTAPQLSAPETDEPQAVEAAGRSPEQVAIDLAMADDVPEEEVVDTFVAASTDRWLFQWVTDDE
jgi:hypothetical protein